MSPISTSMNKRGVTAQSTAYCDSMCQRDPIVVREGAAWGSANRSKMDFSSAQNPTSTKISTWKQERFVGQRC